MINRINDLLKENELLPLKQHYQQEVTKAKKQGYAITLLFFWLNNIELAKERVKTRVKEELKKVDIILQKM